MHEMTLERSEPKSSNGFEVFYRAERDHVFRVLTLTLRDRDLAADATDEAMARAYQRWRTVSSYDNPSGWVYRVALNWATSRLRRRRYDAGHEPRDGWTADVQVDVDLERALSRLDVESRALVVLKHLEGLQYSEIGGILAMPTGTVKSRLHRVMQELRTVLEVAE